VVFFGRSSGKKFNPKFQSTGGKHERNCSGETGKRFSITSAGTAFKKREKFQNWVEIDHLTEWGYE